MSYWHKLSDSVVDRAFDLPWREWPYTTTTLDEAPDTTDILSNPTLGLLQDQHLMLLPMGMAWRTPDGAAFADANTSVLGRFVKALSKTFGDLYRRAYELTQESTAISLLGSLEDWEAEYGLPDPCLPVNVTQEVRKRWLMARIRDTGTITPGDFMSLARDLGVEVVIEEPTIFESGRSETGWSDQVGSYAGEHFWIVHILEAAEYPFKAGIGETGFTPLYDFDNAESLECMFLRLAPIWSIPYFDYSNMFNPNKGDGWPDVWQDVWTD